MIATSVLNLFSYPELRRYQAGSEAAATVNRLSARRVGLYGMLRWSVGMRLE